MSTLREEQKAISRRVGAFLLISGVLLSFLVLRIVYLQVYNSHIYSLLSDKNRIVVRRILPDRGRILDAKGRVLASNYSSYAVTFDILSIPNEKRQETIQKFLSFAKLPAEIHEKFQNLPNVVRQRDRYIVLNENASWDELERYAVLSNLFPAIKVEKTSQRHYLHPFECSHFLGYTGTPNKEDIDRTGNQALMLPTAKVGKNGIEKQYEYLLFGQVGLNELEVNSRRQVVRVINERQSIPGKDLYLTVNLDLQKEVYRLLSEHRSAACVVMDVKSGGILAFVSYPGYDINSFAAKISSQELKKIYADPDKPLINKVSNGIYAPGSTFKMMTGLAGLEAGVINKHTRFNCPGYYDLGKHRFYCWKWKYGGHGAVNLEEALEQSCDVFFFNIAKRINPYTIAKVAAKFGLGARTGIDLPHESCGLMPDPDWKKLRKRERWSGGDTFNMSIGQGYVLATPLQLCCMVASLVNGGKKVVPHFVATDEIENLDNQIKFDNGHIEVLLNGMYDVVNSGMGTARRSVIDDENFEMAGKTGSSQVCRITKAQRAAGKTVSEIYANKEHALFVAFAPAEAPRFAVALIVEHGGGGASVAAPIAREVMLATRKFCL